MRILLAEDDRSQAESIQSWLELDGYQVDWVERGDYALTAIEQHDYDCILPFSGGKDSTFTLLYAVKDLKLKPLVVSFDHGFYRPKLIANRQKVLNELGVDFLSFTPNWKLVQKLMLN